MTSVRVIEKLPEVKTCLYNGPFLRMYYWEDDFYVVVKDAYSFSVVNPGVKNATQKTMSKGLRILLLRKQIDRLVRTLVPGIEHANVTSKLPEVMVNMMKLDREMQLLISILIAFFKSSASMIPVKDLNQYIIFRAMSNVFKITKDKYDRSRRPVVYRPIAPITNSINITIMNVYN